MHPSNQAHYINDARDMRIIRPLALLRERLTREFASAMRLPIISENCPACFEGPKERYHIKKLLSAEEALNPTLFACLERAMLPLMTERGAVAVRWAAEELSGAGTAASLEPTAAMESLRRILAESSAQVACDEEDEEESEGPVDLRAFVAAEVAAVRRSREGAVASSSLASSVL